MCESIFTKRRQVKSSQVKSSTTRRTRGSCVIVWDRVCVKLKRVDAIQRSARAAAAPADSYNVTSYMYRLYLVLRACVWNVRMSFDIYIYIW